MTEKELLVKMLEMKFGVTPTEEQIAKLQALAKDRTIPTDAWNKMAEQIMTKA